MLEEILEYNRKFVKNREYERYISDKYPSRKIAILTCMDTRLTELLPAALGIKNGDVKMIKNAGALVSSPFGSIMRSLMVAVYDLNVEEILVIGHYGCGMQKLDSGDMLQKMEAAGIPMERIEMLRYCGIDFESWLCPSEGPEVSVRETVQTIKNHPLMPGSVKVYGLVMDPKTGKLDRV